jgi:hypothetical protein
VNGMMGDGGKVYVVVLLGRRKCVGKDAMWMCGGKLLRLEMYVGRDKMWQQRDMKFKNKQIESKLQLLDKMRCSV